ncbi:diguanylate cyclase (GGDEF)-like protein [Afipia massiliensis]|uniref:diguanylate cyclase n=1 Tax=Afipia massiliensis TaxID=211460 RepID=A0A840MZ33_9BRAD|nr:diguanylate cyclase [Afipia massiliensis]MBB5052002.1 diguanylate cyclase (GGDEF)-like protein [Afipia massiliensis]
MSIASFGRNTSKLKALVGIRARLVILALILVVPLMLDRVRVLEDTRSRQVAQAANELSELAKHTADAQREIISTVQAVVKSSAYIYAAASQHGRGCAVMRASLRVDLPWIRNISIIGPEGKIDCSTKADIVGFDLSDRDYFLKARELHEFVLSDYIPSRITTLPTMIAAYPVSAVDGRQESVVIAAIDLKWMSQLLTNRGGRSGVSVVLVDGTGTILASPPESANLIGQKLKDTSLFEAVTLREINLDREYGSISFQSADGERKAVSFARVTGTRARMIVSINQSVMLGDINREIRTAYIQLGLVGLITLLGAWFAGERLIMRPVRTMTDMANRLGRGELSARASSATLPPEFVPLAKAFDAMASQLSEREREMAAANDRLTVIASHDLVSGLANRRGFQSRLEFEWMKALQSDGRLSVLMIDVDHFKLFNDTYGHPEGDTCLRRIGEVLAAIANSCGGFAARYGGEEFCLLLPNSDPAHAVQVGEQVRATVEGLGISHLTSPGQTVTVSVGVATIAPGESQPQDDLIEAADAALYAAKRRGRNAVVEHGLIRPADQPVSLAG